MQSLAEEKSDLSSGFSTAAKALASMPKNGGQGRGEQSLVRMTPAVKQLLVAAKAPKQSLPEFMRECALAVALERLEVTQRLANS